MGYSGHVFLHGDACEKVKISKKEFVKTAAMFGIEWEINEVVSVEEFGKMF